MFLGVFLIFSSFSVSSPSFCLFWSPQLSKVYHHDDRLPYSWVILNVLEFWQTLFLVRHILKNIEKETDLKISSWNDFHQIII